MIQTGLEFAPKTTDDCKQLVGKLYPPDVLLSSYRVAREMCNSTDIVLVASDQDPDISGGTRVEYTKHLRQMLGARAAEFKIFHESAQKHMMLPPDSEAMWLVVNMKGMPIPTMCVIYATPYKISAVN